MADLIDSYSESNYSTDVVMYGTTDARGQSFACSLSDRKLDSAKFYLKKSGSPTGNAVAKLYSHSGTYGSSSVPGTLLATSDNFDVSTLTTSSQLITFTFSGSERIDLSNSTNYVIVVSYSGGDGLNHITCGVDNASPTHGGNFSYYNGSWGYMSNYDVCFYVYGAAAANGGQLTLLGAG